MSNLQVFLMHDQPHCCPKCGARTDYEIVDSSGGAQHHTCPRCEYEFLVEEDPERERDDQVAALADALRGYMRLVKYFRRTTNPEEWATHGDWAKLEREAIEALEFADEDTRV
ncbi:MAG TPA: hypothetical protein PKZ27_02950 [Rhodocyclaceae bacterium]|nr:hypothetical protein [Burkholderiaceae bacterium]HRP74524.1 hypothetical protein [Rhodocyclaceae bacterium]